ncbi:MAG: hypothetical protein UR51_C0008G0095 [Candidatus Moranbacteria bacterium GW2011_GWF1_34_10]|nr:MAG: hypothetical protein UR51_C0008G0095 [Candidatus Moranbacteria bacterium GW2011_GWF1_34_10]
MGKLEERFFGTKQETIIKPGNENTGPICRLLSKGLLKGNFILRGGNPTRYNFNFDRIYD